MLYFGMNTMVSLQSRLIRNTSENIKIFNIIFFKVCIPINKVLHI